MKRFTKWMLLLGLAGPTIIVPSCSSALLREVRTATFGGVSQFLGSATADLLETNLGSFLGGG